MNEGSDKSGAVTVHPPADEFDDAKLAVADLVLEMVRTTAHDTAPYSEWCGNMREQLAYEATCIVLGVLDGRAVMAGVPRPSLDRSLRGGLAVGRRVALAAHQEEGCRGCEGARDLDHVLTGAN